MKPEYEIVCVQRDGNYLTRLVLKKKLSYIGYKLETGETVVIPSQKAIALIKNDACSFYVKDGAERLNIVVRKKDKSLLASSDREYLQSEINGNMSKKLYQLPKCTTNRG